MGTTFGKRISDIDSHSTYLQEWMSILPDDIRTKIPIIHLAIPGTHNSMTFDITRKSKLAPDADQTVRRIHRCFPWIIHKWAKTQQLSVTDQLNNGIRFFDLRISKWENVKKVINEIPSNIDIYYFVHGLYAASVHSAMNEINTFLENHPGEFVILDFQHFYDLQFEDHQALNEYMKNLFGTKIFTSFDGNMSELTLTQAYSSGKQIVIIYRNPYAGQEYWSGKYWPTPWPNTASLKKLKSFLDRSLQYRSKEFGWVSQCILTPDAAYIAKMPFKGLESTAKKVLTYLENWIKEQEPGLHENHDGCTKRYNVFIADFVDLQQKAFITEVINLNKKLLS